MVQNVGNSGFGSITKVGQTPEGRCIYDVRNPKGEITTKLTIDHKDCDLFVKSYNDIMEVAPKLEAYAEKAVSPDFQKQKKRQV